MKIEVIEGEFSVLKLRDFSGVDISKEFTFAAATDTEFSLVCPSVAAPETFIKREDGWRALRIVGATGFFPCRGAL